MNIKTHTPLIPEILQQVNNAPDKASKIAALKNAKQNHLIEFFRIAYSGDEYNVAIPNYRPSRLPFNQNPSNLFRELRKMQIFSAKSDLPAMKKEKILKNLLESVRADEATLVIDILTGSFKLDGLTVDEVKTALLEN